MAAGQEDDPDIWGMSYNSARDELFLADRDKKPWCTRCECATTPATCATCVCTMCVRNVCAATISVQCVPHERGGTVSAQSDGVGCGSEFTILCRLLKSRHLSSRLNQVDDAANSRAYSGGRR